MYFFRCLDIGDVGRNGLILSSWIFNAMLFNVIVVVDAVVVLIYSIILCVCKYVVYGFKTIVHICKRKV